MDDDLNKLEAESGKEKAKPPAGKQVPPGEAGPSEKQPPAAQPQPHRGESKLEKGQSLKGWALHHISDPDLKERVSETSGDDQTWIIYALIADAAKTREGASIAHLRNLFSDGTVEGFIDKHLEQRFAPLGKNLHAIDKNLTVLRAGREEDENAMDRLAVDLAQKIRADVKKAFTTIGQELEQNVDKVVAQQKMARQETAELFERSERGGKPQQINHDKIAELVSDQVTKKVSQGFVIISAIAVMVGIAFGAMAGVNFSRGFSQTDIQNLVRMTAQETAEQMRSQPPGQAPRR